MYLLDSILKNIGEPYVSIFSKNIATLFLRAFTAVNADEKARLQRLAGTWPGLFPPEVLSAVQRSWGGAGPHGTAAGQPPPPYGSHVLPGGVLPGVSAAGGLRGNVGGTATITLSAADPRVRHHIIKEYCTITSKNSIARRIDLARLGPLARRILGGL